MTDYTDPDRERGITPSDREFLLNSGEGDFEEQTVRQKWYRIRRRVRSMVQDLSLLFEALPQDRLGQVFYPDDDEERRELGRGMRAGLGLFFLQQYEGPAYSDLPDDWDIPPERFFVPEFEQNRLVEAGLRRALEARGDTLHQYEDFEYQTAPLNRKELLRQFNSGEPLTLEEFETIQREATTADIRWQARVVNESAFSSHEEITEGDEILLPRERQLIWNASLDEFEDVDRSDDSTSNTSGSDP